jgi:MFS family permease
MLAVVATTAAAVMPVFLVGSLAVQLRADLQLGPAVLGSVVTGFFAVSALTAALAGGIADRFGCATVMRASCLLSAVCLVAIGLLVQDIPQLAVAVALAGAANGAGQPASNGYIAAGVAPHRRGTAFGVKQAAVPLSTLLAGSAVPIVAVHAGWRPAFIGAGVLAALATVVVRSPQAGAGGDDVAVSPAAGPFRLVPLLVLAFGLMLGSAAGNSLAAFLVSASVATGVSPGTAGVLAAAASGAGIVTRLLVGVLADRQARRWLLLVAGMLTVGALGFVLLAFGNPVVFTAGAIVAYCCGWGWVGLATYAVAQMHADAPARATGITQAGHGVGGALGPFTFGLVLAHASYQAAWLTVAGSALVGAAAVVVARRQLLKHRPVLMADLAAVRLRVSEPATLRR